MLAIEVEYLTGRAVATNRQARNEPEWPPHPQRLFSALVAAMHECEFGDDARHALIWLESQQPPDLAVSKAAARVRPETYVPINDSNAQIVLNRRKRTLKFMPAIDPAFAIGRDRKERHFPTVKPDDPVVQFIWTDIDKGELKRHRAALAALCEAVPYLGHSSSLVRVDLVDSHREATLRTGGVSLPKDADLIRLRGITSGAFEATRRCFCCLPADQPTARGDRCALARVLLDGRQSRYSCMPKRFWRFKILVRLQTPVGKVFAVVRLPGADPQCSQRAFVGVR